MAVTKDSIIETQDGNITLTDAVRLVFEDLDMNGQQLSIYNSGENAVMSINAGNTLDHPHVFLDKDGSFNIGGKQMLLKNDSGGAGLLSQEIQILNGLPNPE